MPSKKPQFKEIPQMTRPANYHVVMDWLDIEPVLARYSKTYKLNLDPDYQRGHVWTEENQIKYVEFILKGGNSSKDIQLNCKGWRTTYDGPMELVDGKQRLEAVRKFLRNELTIFGKHKFKDYIDGLPPHASFMFHVNDLATRKDVIQWYLDMNTGGVIHSNDEINRVKKILAKEK